MLLSLSLSLSLNSWILYFSSKRELLSTQIIYNMIEFFSYLLKQTAECFFYIWPKTFFSAFLQNLTDANEEYQKQVENMRAQIEDAVGQLERTSEDYVKLKVKAHKKNIFTNPEIKNSLFCLKKIITYPMISSIKVWSITLMESFLVC